MTFAGSLLRRGFWLYVWRVEEGERQVLYVGRTGDSSSCFASSPFRRIGQHLDQRADAKGNAMARRLREAGIDPADCVFTMTAVGPLYAEQTDLAIHRSLRDTTGALESWLAAWLRARGYSVLGNHGRRRVAEPPEFAELKTALEADYPNLVEEVGA